MQSNLTKLFAATEAAGALSVENFPRKVGVLGLCGVVITFCFNLVSLGVNVCAPNVLMPASLQKRICQPEPVPPPKPHPDPPKRVPPHTVSAPSSDSAQQVTASVPPFPDPVQRPRISVVGYQDPMIESYAKSFVEQKLVSLTKSDGNGEISKEWFAVLYVDSIYVNKQKPDSAVQYGTKVAHAAIRLDVRNAADETLMALSANGDSSVYFADEAPPDSELKRTALSDAISRAFDTNRVTP